MKNVSDPGPALSDFWRASPEGKMFLVRGYQEDQSMGPMGPDRPPGTLFSLSLPIWRIAECLLHAERLARALGDESARVVFATEWDGLSGRQASYWPSRYGLLTASPPGTALKGQAASAREVDADRISEELERIVQALVAPLFEVFGFFEVPADLVFDEIAKLRQRQQG